jgi:hypothetical protein
MKKYLLPPNGNFYKANLHCHSTYSDGELTPKQIKEIYLQQGYSIVAFTDHDILLSHQHLTDDKFLALNGLELEINESYKVFKDGLNKLLDGVKPRNRGIFLKKFGIGLPRPMLPKEIAEQEGLSKARVSQIFQTVIEQIQENSVKYNINPDVLFNALRKTQ